MWLAFAAMPCSALEGFGVDLGHSHVPTVAAADHACPHCPPGQPSASTPGDCTGLDDAVVTKVASTDLVLAAPAALPTLVVVRDPGRCVALPQQAASRPPAVPLNLRYCTFLE